MNRLFGAKKEEPKPEPKKEEPEEKEPIQEQKPKPSLSDHQGKVANYLTAG